MMLLGEVLRVTPVGAASAGVAEVVLLVADVGRIQETTTSCFSTFCTPFLCALVMPIFLVCVCAEEAAAQIC